MQAELRASKQKVKLKGQVTCQQDNLLNERQSTIEKAQAENATLRNELTALKAYMEDKKTKVVAENFIICSIFERKFPNHCCRSEKDYW